MSVVTICVLGFILLAAGEFYLYRQQMHLNKMISEGFMQLKEDNTMPDENGEMMQTSPSPAESGTMMYK
jgi:hypothetical protein